MFNQCIKGSLILVSRVVILLSILTFFWKTTRSLKDEESYEMRIWEKIFEQVYQVQKKALIKNEFFSNEQNQSIYNVIESPVYCSQSDAYKVLHEDTLLKDKYIWRDFPRSNLQMRITTERTYVVFPNLPSTACFLIFYKNIIEPGLKFLYQFPKEMSYIYTSAASLYNNYYWGRGLGCTFQKYNHMPGRSSMGSKDQLIKNFINSIDTLKQNRADPECIVMLDQQLKKNASFIPDTFRLNLKQDCQDFFQYLNSENYRDKYQQFGPQFILKTNDHRGEGITVLFQDQIQQVKKKFQNGDLCYAQTEVIIAQKYITNPFLYKGHKIEFRIYFLIASTNPIIGYAYKRALIKRCAKAYNINSTDKAAHVCNTAITEALTGQNQNDSTIEKEEFFIDWNLEGIQEILLEQGRIKDNNWLQDELYPRIHRSLIHMVRSTDHSFARDSRFAEFLAVDFLLDDNLDVWVLEVNHSPQILSITPDRIIRNFKMIEDTFEIQFAYIRSKFMRIRKYLNDAFYQEFLRQGKVIDLWGKHYDELVAIQKDFIEPGFQIGKENLYVKIIDESFNGTEAYSNLISKRCLI